MSYFPMESLRGDKLMPELKRVFGIPMLMFYGIGMILGAGIYTIIGKAAGLAGDSLWISFICAGVVALLTAFSYAELASMFPSASAEFHYLSQAFKKRKWLAESAATVMAFSGAATAATVAVAFTGYFNQFFSGSGIGISISLLTVFTLVAIIGIQATGWTNILFTLIEIGGLALIIYLGWQSESFGNALSATPHMGTLSATALIIFSFFGFENIVTLAEESKDPEKKIPTAIFLSLAISTALYILVSLAALALLPSEKLAASGAALMTAAQTSSQNMGRILGGIALFSTANTALISMVGASRILYGMSKEKALPKALSKILPKRKTPWVASLVITAAALVLLPLSKVETIASVASLTTMFVFLLVNLALISLRFSDEKRKRPFRVPLSVGKVPILSTLGALFSFILIFQFDQQTYLISGGFLLLMIVLFYIRDRRRSN